MNNHAKLVQRVLVPVPNVGEVMMTLEEANALRHELNVALCVKAVEQSEILAVVCEAYDIRLQLIMSDTRLAHIAWARQVAMYLYRRTQAMSLGQIGAKFPKQNGSPRDHGTVLHACRKVVRVLKRGGEDADTVNKLMKQLLNKV